MGILLGSLVATSMILSSSIFYTQVVIPPLVVSMLGCSSTPSSSSASAVQPSPAATLDLPGAAGTPVVILRKNISNVTSLADIFVTADWGFFGGKKTVPPVFPSGIKKIILVLEFNKLSKNTKIETRVNGRNGPVAGGKSYNSKSSANGRTTLTYDLVPKSGVFEDGPYQAIVHIDGDDVAKLNWTVGASQ